MDALFHTSREPTPIQATILKVHIVPRVVLQQSDRPITDLRRPSSAGHAFNPCLLPLLNYMPPSSTYGALKLWTSCSFRSAREGTNAVRARAKRFGCLKIRYSSSLAGQLPRNGAASEAPSSGALFGGDGGEKATSAARLSYCRSVGTAPRLLRSPQETKSCREFLAFLAEEFVVRHADLPQF